MRVASSPYRFQRLHQNHHHFFIPFHGKRPFSKEAIPQKALDDTTQFAYEMSYGSGYHRNYRSGGKHQRNKGEIFCNAYQGKLAEAYLYHHLTSQNIVCSPLDFDVYGKYKWDEVDLIANNETLNIKSAAYFSNLLLLEAQDWDQKGNYLPNQLAQKQSTYDYFILIRIFPDIKTLFRKQQWFYHPSLTFDQIKTFCAQQQWHADFAGFITYPEFYHLIEHHYFLPQNSLLQGKIKMDADNYYVLAGDMHPFTTLISMLQKTD